MEVGARFIGMDKMLPTKDVRKALTQQSLGIYGRKPLVALLDSMVDTSLQDREGAA